MTGISWTNTVLERAVFAPGRHGRCCIRRRSAGEHLLVEPRGGAPLRLPFRGGLQEDLCRPLPGLRRAKDADLLGPLRSAECVAARPELPNYDLEVKVRSGRRIWINLAILVFRTNTPNAASSCIWFVTLASAREARKAPRKFPRQPGNSRLTSMLRRGQRRCLL